MNTTTVPVSFPSNLADGIEVHTEIDTSGLTCPLPILRAKKALAQMPSGAVLQVKATDKNSLADFQAFCAQTKNTLLAQKTEENVYFHWLQKKTS